MKIIFLFLLLAANYVFSQTSPTFTNEGLLKYSDGTVMTVEYQMIDVPCVADWNGDGVRDLIIGYFYNGYVFAFINSGTNDIPVFKKDDMYQLKAGGLNISVPWG